MQNTASLAAGVNVRGLLGRHKMSQQALGERIGMSQASLSLRLNGHVPFTIDELAKIAAVFEVSIETLTEGVAA